jgi:hypothetical protein
MSKLKNKINAVVRDVSSRYGSEPALYREEICRKACRILENKDVNCAADNTAHEYLVEALDEYC